MRRQTMNPFFPLTIFVSVFVLSGCLFVPGEKNGGGGRRVIDGLEEGPNGLLVPGPKGDSAGFLGIVSKVLYDVGDHVCPNGQTFPFKSALAATQDKTYRQFDPCAEKIPVDNEAVVGGTAVTGVVASPVGIAHLDNALYQAASTSELEEGDSRHLEKAGIWCVYPTKSKTPSETIEAKEFVFYLHEKNFTFFSTTYRKDKVENIAVLGGAESFGLYTRAAGTFRGLHLMQQRVTGKTIEGYLQIYIDLLKAVQRGAYHSDVKIHQTWVNDYPEFQVGHAKGYCYVDSSVTNFTSSGAILKQKR